MSLTADSLYVSKTDDNQILDLIPLIEVTKFELAAILEARGELAEVRQATRRPNLHWLL